MNDAGLSYPAEERTVTAVAARSYFETKCPENVLSCQQTLIPSDTYGKIKTLVETHWEAGI